jgi:hypothetical protein
MKFHSASKPPVTGPVVTGRNGEVSTPTSLDPAKPSEDSYQTAAFQTAGPIVQKSLEQFLSGARFGRGFEIISVSWASIGAEPESLQAVALPQTAKPGASGLAFH